MSEKNALEKPQLERTPGDWYAYYTEFQREAGNPQPPLTKSEFVKAYEALDEVGRGIIETDLIIGSENTASRNKKWGVQSVLHGQKPKLETYVNRIKEVHNSVNNPRSR